MSAPAGAPAAGRETIGPVTLVVPVRDEAATLGALFTAIRAQTRPPDAVLLVDAGSADGTADLARRLAGEDSRFRIVMAGPATPGRARNVGIAHAATEWIALTDAGVEPAPTWLEELEAAAIALPGCEVAYGTYEPAVGSLFEQCAALAYVAPRRSTPAGELRGPFIASSLVRRGAWAAVGGFPDLRAGEDTVFMERLERRGARTAWAPRASVSWTMQPDLARTFRRFRVFARVGALAGRQDNWHFGVLRIYAGAAAITLVARLGDRRLAVLVPLGGLARVTGAILQRRDGRPLTWALRPAHIAGVALILATTDLALFIGWSEAIARAAAVPQSMDAR
jgi:glycosyltransferase involved in cell wall biosynthesis